MNPEEAPFQPGDKVIVLPTGKIAEVVQQYGIYEGHGFDGWGDVQLKYPDGRLVVLHQCAITALDVNSHEMLK